MKWNGHYVAGISKVSALKRITEVIEHREGGDPSSSRKSPGRTQFEAITLERGVTHDPEFEQWANKVWNFGAGLGSEVSLKDFRKDITIELYNEAGQLVIAYKVFRCWVSEFQALPDLDAIELMMKSGLELVGWHREVKPPFEARHPVYLLVECAAHQSPLPRLIAELETEQDSIVDSIIAVDERTRLWLWEWREGHVEAATAYCARNQLRPAQAFDVSLPARILARFVESLPDLVAGASPGAVPFLYGHLGDGNLHLRVVGGGDPSTLESAILEDVARCGGSISAEHGIGASRRGALHLNRSAVEIDLFRSIKRAFDPKWILNPNVLLPQ